MATGFADRYAAEFEEDKHPRDEDGQFTLKVSKIHGGKQQDLFAFRGEKGQMNLFSDAGVPDELLPKHIRKGKPDTYAKDEDPPDSGPQWMTLGGGARALVAEDGTILQGCEGVKGYDLDELDETRDERAAKQEQAEDAGWTSAKSDRARETWEAFKNSDPTHPHFIGLVRHGGKFHAFDESAGKLQEQLGIGDGQTAEFDEDKLPHHMERLIENGHRVAVIDRAEDGTPDLDSDADPEAQQAVAEAHEDVAEQQETKPAAAGFGIEPVHPERLKLTQDGREIGYMNLRVMGDRGYIDDTSIHAAARGQGVMRQLWPQIEQHFRDQGATSIRADVVDPAVGEKVWGPLGFQKEGMSGPVEVYRKHLDSPAADSEQATDKPPSTKRGRLPSTDDPAHHAVAQRFGIPPETVKEILETHPDELSRRDNYFPPNSQRDEVVGPTLDYEPHPLGSAKIDSSQHKAGETDNAYVDFLTEFDPQQLKLSEPEDGMSKSQSVAAYADWIKAGMEPPPISVFDSANGNGNLVSTNRRRVLAAQQAGADKIVGWHGKNNPETGLPLKLGDIKRAYEEAKGQGAAASESDQQEQTPADTAGEADDWNAATQSPAEATDDQLARAIEFASHLHGHHQRNAQSGQITPEQLTSLHDMIDGHVATMQAELERRKHAQDQPADRGNAAASPGGTDDASATGAETRPTSGTAAADPGPTGSLGTRHHDAGQRIAQAPGPVRSLLESLHRLRDTRKTGQVETKELGHEYAREMYDHLKSLRHAGDDFGEVHDLSQELGHGAIGYASPAGNVAMVPPKFKGQDWQVRYTLPHESQQAPAATPADAPSEPAGQGDELELLDDVMEGDAYEGDLPASDAGGGFPWEDAGQDEPPTAPSQQPAYSDAWRDLHAQHQDLVYRTIPHREQQYRQAVSQAQRDQQRFAAKAAEYQSQADQLESVTPRDPAHAVRMKSDRPYAEARRRIDKLRKMSADLDRKADEAKLHPRIEFARQQLAASQSAAEQLAQQKAEAGGALAPEVDPDTGKSISRRAYLAKQRAAGRAVQQGKGVSPRTPLGRAIIAAVGDDPVEQQHFGEVLKEIHANDIDAVRNRNDAIKETLANFGFMGRDVGKFLQAIRKYEDADQFLRKSPLGNKFDQMTEYALTHFGGEVLDVAHTRAHDDPESAFFETLQRGLKRVPEPHDDEVVSKALEYYLSSLESSRAHQERLKTDPAYREEMDAIERGDYTFSRQGAKIRYARWARQRLSRWYRYARQLSLFDRNWTDEDEQKHPRDDHGRWSSKSGQKHPATGLTAEEMAHIASRHGHDYHDALAKITSRPSSWIHAIQDMQRREATQSAADKAEAIEQDWKQNGVRSKAFKSWFGDWERDPVNASKVVDKDGKPAQQEPISGMGSQVVDNQGLPVAMYHGTSSGEFEAFEKRWGVATAGENTDNLLYGPGFYFTDNQRIAGEYSNIAPVVFTGDVERFKRESLETAEHMDYAGINKADARRVAQAAKRAQSYTADQIANATKIGGDVAQDVSLLKTWLPTRTVEALWKSNPNPHVFKVYLNIRRPFDADKGVPESVLSQLTPDQRHKVEKPVREAKQAIAQAQKYITDGRNMLRQMKDAYDRSKDEKVRAELRSSKEAYEYQITVKHQEIERLQSHADRGVPYSLVADELGGKAKLNEILKDHGYDGITHIGGRIMGKVEHRVWIAFEPNQIKSADNKGTFNPSDNRMRYSESAEQYCKQRFGREWYRYARQLSLFDDPGGLQTKPKPKGQQKSLFDEDDHPRATEHVEIKGKSYEGGQWIPKDEAAQASPAAAEKIEVVDQDTGQAKPLDEVEEQPSPKQAATTPTPQAEPEKPAAEAVASDQESLPSKPTAVAKHAIDIPTESIFAQGRKRSVFGQPGISVKSMDGDNAIWRHQGDPQQVLFNAAQKGASEWDLKKAAEIKAAHEAGYQLKNYRAGKYGTLWVYEKDGRTLTQRGAEALVAGTGSVDAGEQQGRETAKPLIDKLQAYIGELPESTTSNFGALVASINRSPLGKHLTLTRDQNGSLRLSDKQGTWHIYEPVHGHDEQGEFHRHLDSSLPRFLAKLRHMSNTNIPEVEHGWVDHDRQSDAAALKEVPPPSAEQPAADGQELSAAGKTFDEWKSGQQVEAEPPAATEAQPQLAAPTSESVPSGWHHEPIAFDDGGRVDKYTSPDGKYQIFSTGDGNYEVQSKMGFGVSSHGTYQSLQEAVNSTQPIEQPTTNETFDPEQHGGYKPLLALADDIDAGKHSAESYKQQYAFWRQHADAFQADLVSRYNAQQLKNIASHMGDPYNAKSNSKQQNAKSIYKNLLINAFHTGDRMFSYGMDGPLAALDRHVQSQSDESLAQHGRSREEQAQKRTAEDQARAAAEEKAIADPQTLDDFKIAIRHHGGYEKLPEHLQAAYDDLYATQRRQGDKTRQSTVQGFRPGTEATGEVGIVEGHHQKRNAPTFTVTIEKHLGDNWGEALSRAKQLGGSYVNARIAKAYGATPGFQFFDRNSAEKFAQTLRGESADRSDIMDERRAGQIENASERMATLAQLQRQRAEEKLNAPRLTNTARRADMASSAEANARSEIAKANTMARISEGLASGTIKHLAGIRARTHVDALDAALRSARYKQYQEQTKGGQYQNYEDFMAAPASNADVAQVQYPYPTIWASELSQHAQEFADTPGLKKLAATLKKTADRSPFAKKIAGFATDGGLAKTAEELKDVPGARLYLKDQAVRIHASRDPKLLRGRHAIAYTADKGKTWGITPEIAVTSAMVKHADALDLIPPPKDELLRISDEQTIGQLETAVGKLKRSTDPRLRRIAESLHGRVEDYKRMQSMDIRNTQELRAALREYLPLRAKQEAEDPVKSKERALIGRNIPGFFPTPRPLVTAMLDAANIQPGMSVLEPSAGKGDILDAIRERHPDVQTTGVEVQPALRDIIQTKGHALADEHDFLDHAGLYDRIVMNPPFENRQDVQHVQHAYERLKPGGRLVAVMSAGPFHGSSQKDQQFQAWLDALGAEVVDNPEGSFTGADAFRQTGVNTKMVIIDK